MAPPFLTIPEGAADEAPIGLARRRYAAMPAGLRANLTRRRLALMSRRGGSTVLAAEPLSVAIAPASSDSVAVPPAEFLPSTPSPDACEHG